MIAPISFRVTGVPKGQPRPRAFAMKFGDKYQARMYDAGTAEGWKSCVAAAAKEFLPGAPLEAALRLTLVFYLPRPKNHYRANATLKDWAPIWFTGKPDADNLAKAVMDALTTLGMWKDDSQVAKLTSVKAYATDKPGCDVTIEEMGMDSVDQKTWQDSVVANLL